MRGRYLAGRMGFRQKGFLEKVIPGSLVLFRKKGLIVGEAIVRQAIHRLVPPERSETEQGQPRDYFHDLYFDPGSVRVYTTPLPVNELETWSGPLSPRTYVVVGSLQSYRELFAA